MVTVKIDKQIDHALNAILNSYPWADNVRDINNRAFASLAKSYAKKAGVRLIINQRYVKWFVWRGVSFNSAAEYTAFLLKYGR